MTHSILPRLIGALGEPAFATVAASELSTFLGFDLSAIVVHRRAQRPAVLFDNFDRIGCREGIRNYVGYTYKINPMLARVPTAGACRARDFAGGAVKNTAEVGDHIVMTDEEELGFRTVGWPRRMEEVDLYIDACGGVVELGFYRERGRSSISTGKLRALDDLTAPLAAAFDKHAALHARNMPDVSMLSPR